MLGTVTEPVAEDWERRYLAHLRPVRVGAVTIRPPWLDGSPEDLVIDPDTTFGAGTHESTRLSLELLQRLEPGGPLCDWGAGSGVLSIAAARLGFGPVTALELDADAAGVIAANARANGVEVAVRAPFDLLADAAAVGADRDREPHAAAAPRHRRAPGAPARAADRGLGAARALRRRRRRARTRRCARSTGRSRASGRR